MQFGKTAIKHHAHRCRKTNMFNGSLIQWARVWPRWRGVCFYIRLYYVDFSPSFAQLKIAYNFHLLGSKCLLAGPRQKRTHRECLIRLCRPASEGRWRRQQYSSVSRNILSRAAASFIRADGSGTRIAPGCCSRSPESHAQNKLADIPSLLPLPPLPHLPPVPRASSSCTD